MASVTIQQVKKNFGDTPILHGVDIDIQDGSFTVLVGPSGCGKSTLLRMIAGLEQISGGEIRIGARRVNELQPKERDIAMVFKNYALYPHMTVRETPCAAASCSSVGKRSPGPSAPDSMRAPSSAASRSDRRSATRRGCAAGASGNPSGSPMTRPPARRDTALARDAATSDGDMVIRSSYKSLTARL